MMMSGTMNHSSILVSGEVDEVGTFVAMSSSSRYSGRLLLLYFAAMRPLCSSISPGLARTADLSSVSSASRIG